MRVCVIGAGVSGVACVKELNQLGIAVDAYEMMPVLGGVFGSYTWKGGQFTSSTVFTWFSEYPTEDRQKFFTWEEFLQYLGDYVDHYDIRESIHLNCKVISAEKKASGWTVSVEKKNWSNNHYLHPRQVVEEENFVREYTHLIVCSGLHNVPYIPKIATDNPFKGTIMHSNEYRDAEDFRGKRVVVVGAGESASDIALQLSKVAENCTISMRSSPGTLFPRSIQGNTPDIRDDRLSYNLPRIWSQFILKTHKRFYYAQKKDSEVFRWAADSNFDNDRCPFNTNACKSFGIPESVVKYKTALKPEITGIDSGQVTFSDKSKVACDTIIFCTGYKARFSFLADEISDKLLPVNNLWKNCIHPELGSSLCLVGFSRPQQVNLVSIAEMQARMISLIIKGDRNLPIKEDLIRDTEKHDTWMTMYYGERYKKNPALVDYLYYMDNLAQFIGCEVPLSKVFFKNPHLWVKLMFSAMNGAHYRLVGPGSNWEKAAKTIKETPQFKNRRNALYRWTVLGILTCYSLLLSVFNGKYKLIKKQASSR